MRWILATLALLPQGVQADTVTVSIDADMLVLLKAVIWVGATFLAILAFIGLVFFGWDVRKARDSIRVAERELRESLAPIREDLERIGELRKRYEALGAQMEELGAQIQESLEAVDKAPVAEGRADIDLIREVIGSSHYKWTTIGRIQKRTGLSHDAILRQARAAPDIVISMGSKTQEHIFCFKDPG